MPCPGPWGPSWRSSVPQSGKHEQSSHGQPCGSKHLRMPWRPSCVWDCVWRVRRTSLAWYPWAWHQSWGTWARMVASSGTGRPVYHRVFERCAVCWTWCCTTIADGKWYVEPSETIDMDTSINNVTLLLWLCKPSPNFRAILTWIWDFLDYFLNTVRIRKANI